MEANMEMTTKLNTFRLYHRRKRDSWPEQHRRPYHRHMHFFWINNLVVALICSMFLLNSCVAAETTQVWYYFKTVQYCFYFPFIFCCSFIIMIILIVCCWLNIFNRKWMQKNTHNSFVCLIKWNLYCMYIIKY